MRKPLVLLILCLVTSSAMAKKQRSRVRREIQNTNIKLPSTVEMIVGEIESSLNGNLDDILTDSIVAQLDKDLTVAQAHVVLQRIEKKLIQFQNGKPFMDMIPPSLLIGVPGPLLFEAIKTQEQREALMQRISKLLPAQKMALFLSFLKDGESSIDLTKSKSLVSLLSKYPLAVSDLMSLMSPTVLDLEDDEGHHQDLEDEIDKLHEKGAVEVVNQMPLAFRQKEMENHGGFKTDETSQHFISAISCHDIKTLASFDSVLNALTEYNEFHLNDARYVFDKDIRNCFEKRILNTNSHEKMSEIGGFVLTAVNFKDAEHTKSRLLEIGSIPMISLIPLLSVSEMETLSNLAVDHKIPAKLGSLVHLASEDVIDKIGDDEGAVGVRNYLSKVPEKGFEKTICMTEENMNRWKRALIKHYGDVHLWTSDILVSLGDLLIVLDSADWEIMNENALIAAIPRIRDSKYNLHYHQSPHFTNETKIALVCRDWLSLDSPSESTSFMQMYGRFMRKIVQTSQIDAQSSTDRVRRDVTDDVFNQVQKVIEFTKFRINERTRRQVSNTPSEGIENTLTNEDFRERSIIRENSLAAFKTFYQDNTENRERASTIQVQMAATMEKVFDEIALLLEKTPEDLGSNIGDKRLAITNILETELDPSLDQQIRFMLEDGMWHVGVLIINELALTEADVNVSKEIFCKHLGDYCSSEAYLESVKSLDSRTSVDLPRITFPVINCNGLDAALEAAAGALQIESLREWSKDELEDCTETLGRIELEPKLKDEVYQLLKKHKVSFVFSSILPPRHLIALNHLVVPATQSDLRHLNLSIPTYLDGVSLIGQFRDFDQNQLEKIVSEIKKNTIGVPFPTPKASYNALIFGSMGHLVCGFHPDVIQTLLDDETSAKLLLPVFGSKLENCPNQQILQTMAEKAQSLYGPTSAWPSSLISNLGVIVAGLKSSDLAAIGDCCLPAITTNAIRHMRHEHIEELAEEQVLMLKLEHMMQKKTEEVRANNAGRWRIDSILATGILILVAAIL